MSSRQKRKAETISVSDEKKSQKKKVKVEENPERAVLDRVKRDVSKKTMKTFLDTLPIETKRSIGENIGMKLLYIVIQNRRRNNYSGKNRQDMLDQIFLMEELDFEPSQFAKFCHCWGIYQKRKRKPEQLRTFLEQKCHLKDKLDQPISFYFFDQDEFWPVLADYGLLSEYDPDTKFNLLGYIISNEQDPICWHRINKLVTEYKFDPRKPLQDEKNPEQFYYKYWNKVIISTSSKEFPALDLIDKFRSDFQMNFIDVRPFLKHIIDRFYLSMVFQQ